MVSISVLAASAASAAGVNSNPAGIWDAVASAPGLTIPFKLQISTHGAQISGWLFNGDTRVVATSGSDDDGHIVLRFDQFARELDATLGADGKLDGTYGPLTLSTKSRARPYAIHAERAPSPQPDDGQPAPSIAGLWLIPAQSRKKNEKAWRLIVRQSHSAVSAAILRVDGDTGTLTGRWKSGQVLLSNFSGTRAELIELAPAAGGTLSLRVYDGRGNITEYTAYRPADAAAKGLPGAADAAHHTTVRDASEIFRFSATDLDGHVVSNADPRFSGKVVLVDVAGSWCPNCHDEAPFLQTLYRRYHKRGLEIVTLDFEEPDQLHNPTRLRAFIKAYHIAYTVLLAGTPDQVNAAIPQAVDLDAWPTTFFIGRDGRVKGVHTGFAAPASGQFNGQLKRNFAAAIEQLLGTQR
ncbi:MAG TPA: TlpA disulfide reductase family protein [Steroidobacteraceae bacterium]|jgi:thiol-disulfide isomerase/thioredoxin|nr:TlpA disulfide reductase family protein [Steroidobacteraceae bacterium]